MNNQVDHRRVQQLNAQEYQTGGVVYWMSRDQRVFDNWALLFAAQKAIELNQPLQVVFCLQPNFLGATLRQYDFMLRGLREVEAALVELGIEFSLLLGNPSDQLREYIATQKIGLLVTDFSPLKIGRQWRTELAKSLRIPVFEVDAHNIVPVWLASPKQEYAARTFRPKISKMLPTFLTDFPNHLLHKIERITNKKIDWNLAHEQVQADSTVLPVEWIESGSSAALKQMELFISERLAHYDLDRNEATKSGQSDLSPYLHFGQLSAQRVALEVEKASGGKSNQHDIEVFLEELIVRRELADNYCYYNANYDSFAGFPAWAQKTLNQHRQNERSFIYSKNEFEQSQTHDLLWNAAQRQMVQTGKMHGYLRMYWAKKILEWTPNPEVAQAIAIYLNDRYQLDGRDPNGYVGVAWSIGGVHDRPWFNRPVFGSIRYMAESGCQKKFNVANFIAKYSS